jgi:hypothetical protein
MIFTFLIDKILIFSCSFEFLDLNFEFILDFISGLSPVNTHSNHDLSKGGTNAVCKSSETYWTPMEVK